MPYPTSPSLPLTHPLVETSDESITTMEDFITTASELQNQQFNYRRSRRTFHKTHGRKAISLLDLPYELRQCIFQHALKVKGTVELQYPAWAGLSNFANPLFRTCRALRSEAIEAFYKCNDFLWIIDTEQTLRSDPATYKNTPVKMFLESPLMPVLPWEYPDVMKHLRRLQLNIYLPREQDAGALEDQLRGFVKAVDLGRRLTQLHVLVTAKRRAAQIPLTMQEVKALEGLADMEVRGAVEVQARYYFRAVAAGVQSLNLKRRMKA